ncbi:endonuclease/exonuclease/phosphatase family protein [Aureivirga sp. CE67]|uniref:endonuclease/exonuclease/phosphatase family protein n=1 Tax=Aureivirga sp. CE67 TaxID=1788983 RepID=UPI0018CB7FB1|nr:endonuclease/exonuclease/phosphatase family protein [Aureivirga sp. CE67]
MTNKLKFIFGITILTLFINCAKIDTNNWNEQFDISIISFNLRFDTEEDGENKWDNRKEACIKALEKTKPSIFGIQEGLYHQVQYLDTNLPNYKYVGVGRDDGFTGGEYSAIFYDEKKFNLIETNNFWLSETPNQPSLGWDANNIRIVTWAHFKDKTNQKSIFVFNTHLDHIGKIARKESVLLLMKKIQEIVPKNETVLITGDFNMLSSNKALKPLLKKFKDSRKTAEKSDNKKSFNFFGNWLISRNIDFVFYKNAKAITFQTINDDFGVPFISDHYPILGKFKY